MHIVYKIPDIIRVTRKNSFVTLTHKHCGERDYQWTGAKPLGIFILFSLAAKQDLRKGKIEGELEEQRQFASFPNALKLKARFPL